VGSPNTSMQVFSLRVSLGYCLDDTLCCLAIELSEGKPDVANTFHHVMTVAGLVSGLYYRRSGHELLLCLLLREVSTPCLHMRSIFREIGMGGTAIADANDIAFAGLFLLCRNVMGAPLVYWTVVSDRLPIMVQAGALGILSTEQDATAGAHRRLALRT
jgi:TLC domain